jgi:N-acetylneuraminic acid mutarotase
MYPLLKNRMKTVARLAMASALLWLACGEGPQRENRTLGHKELELMDLQTSTPAAGGWVSTGALAQARNAHVAALLPSGKVLVAGGVNGSSDLSSAEVYNPDTHSWTAARSMNTARREFTATALPNGKVLVAGGHSNGSFPNSAEVYDPATDSWSYTRNTMASRRRRHTATLLLNGKVLVTGGYYYVPTWPEWSHYYVNGAEVYDPVANSWTQVRPMNAAREVHTATLLHNGKVLVVGGGSGGSSHGAEVYDPVANSWTPTLPMGTNRSGHTATALPNGKVLIAGGHSGSYLSTSEVYDPADNSWSSTSNNMSSPRLNHWATLLPNGKVLVAGGSNGSALNTAELYDPATNSWSSTTNSMTSARYGYTATLLSSGKVLVAGGNTPSTSLTTAEVYDPDLNIWEPANSMFSRRQWHTATVLPNDKVLVAGGVNGSSALNSAELYDPATDTWSSTTNSMTSARSWHTATALPNGKVLVAGGLAGSTYLDSAEVYDPDTGSWSPTINSMISTRQGHTATALSNDKVLVVGGFNGSYLNSAEVYDPANGWSPTGTMALRRQSHTATVLPNGKVLVVGGFNGSHLSSAEVYDPANGSWSSITNSMASARSWHTATVLPNGKVLVAGGFNGSSALSSAEVYDPATNSWTEARSMNLARREHAATVMPNGKVLIVGGFNGSHLNHAEVYDPDTGEWSPTDALAEARYHHTATLLPSGMVLVTGGEGSDGSLSSTEKYILIPLVVLTPADGSPTNSRPASSGTAEPGITVMVIVDEMTVGTTTATDSGNWSLQHPVDLALVEGPHSVKAMAKDAVGNITLKSNINTFTVDATPPAAPVVLTPADGLATNNTRPASSGTAEPGITVTVIVDGVTVGTTTATDSGNWSLQHPEDLALVEGSHSVKALARDAVGNKSPESNIHTFTVDITLPAAPVVLTPADGSATNDTRPAYSGTAEPGNKVTVWLDGEVAGEPVEADSEGNWTLTQTTELPDKEYEVRVSSMDAAGNVSLFSEVQFTVDTVDPSAPEVNVPESFNTQTPTIAGTAEPNSTVTVYLDKNKTVAETVEADAAGTWSFTPAAALEFGSYVIFATATDAAGNISPDSTKHTFAIYIERSHYGWSCTTAPALPVTWALLALGLLLRRRRLRSP